MKTEEKPKDMDLLELLQPMEGEEVKGVYFRLIIIGKTSNFRYRITSYWIMNKNVKETIIITSTAIEYKGS